MGDGKGGPHWDSPGPILSSTTGALWLVLRVILGQVPDEGCSLDRWDTQGHPGKLWSLGHPKTRCDTVRFWNTLKHQGQSGTPRDPLELPPQVTQGSNVYNLGSLLCTDKHCPTLSRAGGLSCCTADGGAQLQHCPVGLALPTWPVPVLGWARGRGSSSALRSAQSPPGPGAGSRLRRARRCSRM